MRGGLFVFVGVVLVILGLVWLLQGVGVLTGSPMTGQQVWTVIGLLLVAGGVALAMAGLRDRRRR